VPSREQPRRSCLARPAGRKPLREDPAPRGLRGPRVQVGSFRLKARTRKYPCLELCCDRRPCICVGTEALLRLETCRVALHLHVAIFFMNCIGFYFHVPTHVHGQARAPEPSAPERPGPPPRRRRACDSPRSRTARRQPHPAQPSGLRDALMRLLSATVGTRLQKTGSNRWTREKCLTPTNLANKWPPILMSASGVS